MQLTTEFIVSVLASALTGATMAWLGSRVVHAELWGHIKRHCMEHDQHREEFAQVERRFDGVDRRFEFHAKLIRDVEREVDRMGTRPERA